MKTDIIMKLTVNSMKIIAIMAIGFMTLSVNAQTFDVGEFEYKVIDGGVEVSKFKQMDDAPFVSIPASVEYESTVYDVIAIGSESFDENSSAVVVELPESIKYIQENAFKSSTLRYINLPEGLESIGDYAFYYSGVHRVTFPSTLRTLGNYAFRGLHGVVLNEGLETIGDYALKGSSFASPKMPSSLKELGIYAFASSDLKSVDFGGNLETLPLGLLQLCENLRTIIIRESVTWLIDISGYDDDVYPYVGHGGPGTHFSYGDDLGFKSDYGAKSIRADFFICSRVPPVLWRSASKRTFPYTCVIHVPSGTKGDYEFADGWKDFKNIIDDLETALPERELLIQEMEENEVD